MAQHNGLTIKIGATKPLFPANRTIKEGGAFDGLDLLVAFGIVLVMFIVAYLLGSTPLDAPDPTRALTAAMAADPNDLVSPSGSQIVSWSKAEHTLTIQPEGAPRDFLLCIDGVCDLLHNWKISK